MLIKIIMLLIGIITLFTVFIKFQKSKWAIVYIIISIGYIILGVLVEDPEGDVIVTLSQFQVFIIFALLSGVPIVSKSIQWAVTRTDLYIKTIKALDSIVKLEDVTKDTQNIRRMYEKIHEKELKKKTNLS